MIEQCLKVPDVEDAEDHDDYNEVLDYLKGAISAQYRGKEVRIVVREVKRNGVKK